MRWLRFPRTLGIVVCLYLLGIAAVFGMLTQQSSHFARNAASTEGTVIALVARAPIGSTRTQPANARTVSQAPQVSYVVDGKTYEYTAAHGRYHQRLKVGDHVRVLYDPADPASARIKGEGKVLVPGITASFGLAALLVAVILFRTRRLGVRDRSAKRRGEPLPAEPDHPATL